VIRTRGYSATTVDDICVVAGVSKGAFFHHFASKEDLAVAAADHWSSVTGNLFAMAAYRSLPDPVDRILGYVEFRKAIIKGELPEFTCLVGTMVQETYDSSPSIRDACNRSISEHAAVIESDIAEAMRIHRIEAEWTPRSLAFYTQAVIQGAFILAKAQQNRAVAADCIDHLLRYLQSLFPSRTRRRRTAAG
jgi:TetR/AcrR family transcriptional regulator, transcriptional repressor for nem operon